MTASTDKDPTARGKEELPFEEDRLFDLAFRAGEKVLAMQREGLRAIHTKSTPNDLVTEADLACETLLREELETLAPSYGFWGEESNQRPAEDRFWLVDPIDGTINFAAGLPWFGINIALIRRNETIFGLSLILPQFDLFWALAGRGAFLLRRNGDVTRLQVSRTASLSDALITTGFPYHRAEGQDNNLAEFARLMPMCRGIRRLGASSADLAYVASGAFGAYWEGSLQPWDLAPGALLVREAGGLVTSYDGAPFGLDDRQIIASNGQPGLHGPLLRTIRKARAERFDRDAS